MVYVPKGAYRIVDTWYVGGLRGTGSHDVVVDEVFVPVERTFSFLDPDQLKRPLSRMPFFATMAAGCAAMCLGIARAALDALLELGVTKEQVGARAGLRDRPAVQGMLGATMASLDAARLLLHDALGTVWTACQNDMPVSEGQRARVWGGASHTAKITKAAVTAIYEAAGTSALYIECPIERAHRDIHAVTQHTVLGPTHLEEAGRVHFGLQPTNPLF
jgi:alkylation response protein AidB-like acyl-CoA dehydrogenase